MLAGVMLMGGRQGADPGGCRRREIGPAGPEGGQGLARWARAISGEIGSRRATLNASDVAYAIAPSRWQDNGDD